MLELGPVPGDLLLLRCPFSVRSQCECIFMHCALGEQTRADCICRDWRCWRNSRSRARGGQGNSLLARPRVLCWNQMLRDVSSRSRGPLWCGAYINVSCTVASADGREGTEAQLLALGRWRVQRGQRYPPPLLSVLCQLSILLWWRESRLALSYQPAVMNYWSLQWPMKSI